MWQGPTSYAGRPYAVQEHLLRYLKGCYSLAGESNGIAFVKAFELLQAIRAIEKISPEGAVPTSHLVFLLRLIAYPGDYTGRPSDTWIRQMAKDELVRFESEADESGNTAEYCGRGSGIGLESDRPLPHEVSSCRWRAAMAEIERAYTELDLRPAAHEMVRIARRELRNA